MERSVKEVLYRRAPEDFSEERMDAGRVLRRAERLLSRERERLSALRREGTPLRGAQRWVLDNAVFCIKQFGGMRRAKPEILRGLFTLFCALFSESEEKLDGEKTEQIFAFLGQRAASHRVLLSVVPSLICAAASELCDLLSSEKEESDGAVERLVVALRFLSGARVEHLVSAYSPLEAVLRRDPSGAYAKMEYAFRLRLCRAVISEAKKHGCEECAYALELLKRAEKTGEYIGAPLEKKHGLGVLYQGLVTATGLLLGFFFAAALSREYPLGAAALIGFVLAGQGAANAAFSLFDAVFSKFVRPQKLWRVKVERLTKENATLVVYPSLVRTAEQIDELCQRLLAAYFASFTPRRGGGHLSFALLVDLAESRQKVEPDDEVLYRYAAEKIAELNRRCGDSFLLFTRPRTRREKGCWCGWERKRGALLSLSAYLCGRESEIVCRAGDARRVRPVSYVLTLDSDTVLTPGALFEMIGILEHPLNRPVVKRVHGTPQVVRGCGVLQPLIVPSAESAAASPFSVLRTGAGGMTAYSTAAYDRAETLFSRGHFCGKGLFSLAAFDAVLQDAFPDGRILSHDLLEGARLSCRLAADVVLLDETPSSARAESERAHRWCRGDVQALFFSGFHSRDRRGRRSFNPIAMYYRAALWDNLRRALIPISSAVLILLSPFVSASARSIFWIAALLPYVVSAFFDALYLLVSGRARGLFLRFSSPVANAFWQRMLNLLYDLSALVWDAYRNLDAILRALWRSCVSHKRCLEWRTASESAGAEQGVLKSVFSRFFSVLGGLFLLLTSPGGLGRLFALLFLLHPVAAALLSRKFPVSSHLSEEKRRTLLSYARRQCAFFVREVGSHTHDLPPDHLTESPVTLCAMRTSPTNVGLYLCALIAAVDLEELEPREALLRITRTVDTLEGLEKWNGLLYNWYDLETLEALDGYVSFVDCGNYLACLAALIGFLEECAERGMETARLTSRVRGLYGEGNLGLLYRAGRELFAIGFDTKKQSFDTAHYDQYMSEARLSSYLAIARGEVELGHWSALSRPLISRGGYLGAASYSGTAFEYFMPCLFLPILHASFEKEALFTAAACQRRAAVRTSEGAVFGVSESAFYATDAQGDYPYRANGIPSLALRADCVGQQVISPYSSFLMLAVCPELAVENLRRLERLGLYGRYGFYEAAECTAQGVDVVKSYFAHHAAMSILAAANALFDNVFVRRFLSEPPLRAMLPLLSERIPAEGVVNRIDAPEPERSGARFLRGRFLLSENALGALVIPAKAGCLLVDFDGYVNLLWRREGGVLLFCPEREGGGLCARALVDGVLYSSRVSENPQSASCECEEIAGGVRFSVRDGTRRINFSFLVSERENALSVETEIVGAEQTAEVALSCALLLATEEEYRAHPAFRTLTLSAKRKSRAAFFTARLRRGGGLSLALSEVSERQMRAPQCLSSDALTAFGGAKRAFVSHAPSARLDSVLFSPEVLFTKRLLCTGRFSRCRHRFVLGFGESAYRAFRALEETARRDESALAADRLRAHGVFLRALEHAHLDSVSTRMALGVTDAVLGARKLRLLPSSAEGFLREELYKDAVSGDLPIVLCLVQATEDAARLREIAALHRYHAICGFSYDLIFFCESDGYLNRGYGKALSAIEQVGSFYLFSRRGGVFVVEGDRRKRELYESAACVVLEGSENVFLPCRRYHVEAAPTKTAGAFFEDDGKGGEGSGRFLKEGFLVERDRFDPPENFAHLLASETFGALLTHRSLGYSFETSSRFRRITRVDCDAHLTSFGERLILKHPSGRRYDLAACSTKVLFSFGSVSYFGSVEGIDYRINVFCHPTLLFRGVEAEFYANAIFELSYEFEPVLGDENGVLGAFSTRLAENVLEFSRAVSPLSRPFSGYLVLQGASAHRAERGVGLAASVNVKGRGALRFYLGAKESEEQFFVVREYLSNVSFSEMLALAEGGCISRLPEEVVGEGQTKREQARALFINRFLPYQAITSRLLARCGFYQAGGAYGFRDQLQDALLYLSFEPERCRRAILRHAAHQFSEGDVLHWWHNLPDGQGRHRGVRTHISDDYLWLVYALCRYVRKTGDADILETQVPFLTGRAIPEGQRDLYEAFAFGEKRPLWEHLYAAADLFLARGTGAHGLALMLDGDWNDGFDALGEGAESVFLSQFGELCLVRLSRLIRAEGGDAARAARYEAFAKGLHGAVQKSFCGRWYARAYFGDGEALGADTSLSSPCSIDLLPQAFAAFCFAEGERAEDERERVLTALRSVLTHLLDRETGVLRLFTPPFGAEGRSVGYIRSYAEGLRENGGQYTHAAIWFAMACRTMARFAESGDEWRRIADEIIEGLLPYRAAFDAEFAARYRLEPYALAGDVCSAPEKTGRGGWNHYTGSAAWLWRYFAEAEDEEPF